jgi:RNA polymerase sigma-70 factor (ECF subfamily)
VGGQGDTDWVHRAIRGDETALKVLLASSHARLVSFISRKIPSDLGRVVAAEDVVQEAHVEVFRRIHDTAPASEDAFFRWCAAIALSRLRNAIAKHRAQKRAGGQRIIGLNQSMQDSMVALLDMLAGPGKTPSRAVARAEAASAVHAALESLPKHYRDAVWLVHIEGQSAAQAGTRLGKTDQAIRGLCRRGLKLLQHDLQSASRFLSSSG